MVKGILGSLGTYGVGAAFLANAFSGMDGDSAFDLDFIADWAETFGMDASFLKEGIFPDLIDGREGPLSLLAGSLTVFPDGMKKYGVYASLIWMAVSLYQDYKSGELNGDLGKAFGNSGAAPQLSPEQAAAQRRAAYFNSHSPGDATPATPASTSTLADNLAAITADPTGTPAVFIPGSAINIVEATAEAPELEASMRALRSGKASAVVGAQHVPLARAGDIVASNARFAVDPNLLKQTPEELEYNAD
ncbi:MAG: hypothetical protein GW778_04880 [Alphaproteobacteria bacterium]|nr:hypothetical protein [Alphaproteobacteria bacterium]